MQALWKLWRQSTQPTLSRTFSNHRLYAQDRKSQRTSKAGQRLLCRGHQCPGFIAGSVIPFFNWRTTSQAATTVRHVLRFLLLRQMWPLGSRLLRGSSLTHWNKFHIFILSLGCFLNPHIHYFSSTHFLPSIIYYHLEAESDVKQRSWRACSFYSCTSHRAPQTPSSHFQHCWFIYRHSLPIP